jgi:hypothetical protein
MSVSFGPAFAQRFSVNFFTIHRKVHHKTLKLSQEVYTRYEDPSGKMSSPGLSPESDILLTFNVDMVWRSSFPSGHMF